MKDQNALDLALEKQRIQESWHKLVIKILSWKELPANLQLPDEKITPSEWNTYEAKIRRTCDQFSEKRVVERLRETKEKITQNGGFI